MLTKALKFKRPSQYSQHVILSTGENMNLVLNDNWKQIFEDTRIPFQKSLSEAFRNVADKVLQGVPYDEIFPK